MLQLWLVYIAWHFENNTKGSERNSLISISGSGSVLCCCWFTLTSSLAGSKKSAQQLRHIARWKMCLKGGNWKMEKFFHSSKSKVFHVFDLSFLRKRFLISSISTFLFLSSATFVCDGSEKLCCKFDTIISTLALLAAHHVVRIRSWELN